MEELIKFKDAQIESLQKELQKHKDFISEMQSDFEKFINELKEYER